jgi:methyltransferase-like protein
MMSEDDLPAEARQLLGTLGDDTIRREQALDMLRNRTFRETILCHAAVAIDRGMSSGVFRQLTFIANYLPRGKGEDTQGERMRFMERFSGREVLTPLGECATVLGVIADLGVKGATLHQISEATQKVLQLSEHEMMRVLVTLWKSGFIDAVTTPLGGMGDRAYVTAVARSQATKASKVTSILHESFALSDVERRALALLDKPVTFAELEALLVSDSSAKDAAAAVTSLCEKGFFL